MQEERKKRETWSFMTSNRLRLYERTPTSKQENRQLGYGCCYSILLKIFQSFPILLDFLDKNVRGLKVS